MAKEPLSKELVPRRIFLRVPLKTSAKVFVQQDSPQEVTLNDISSGGLSFYLSASQTLPDYFGIEFHLEPSARPIKATLAVKNRVPAGDKLRIGCSFFQISDADKNHITQFICKFTNLIKPLKALTLATSLCCIDALWRIPAYLLYCRGVEYERLAKVSIFCRLYFLVLLLYAASAAAGFILSGRPVEKFGKSRFLINVGCMIGVFVFVIVKTVEYLIFSIGNPAPALLDVFIGIYVILAIYVSYTLILSLAWARKIDVTSEILERHYAFSGM